MIIPGNDTWISQYMVPRKNMNPVRYAPKKAFSGFWFSIAKNKGTKATQASIQKLNPGKESINKTADNTANDRR